MPTIPAPGPYFNGMCFEELAAMYPYRAAAIIAAGQGSSGGLTPTEYAAFLATLQTSPAGLAAGQFWNNGGVATQV